MRVVIARFVAAALLVTMTGGVAEAVDSPATQRKLERQRRMQRVGAYERARTLVNVDNLKPADGDLEQHYAASVVDDIRRGSSMFASLDVDTVIAPGLEIGITSYDYQHNASSGHQVARANGAGTTHFTWMYWGEIQQNINNNDRYVHYNSYDIGLGQFNQGFNGEPISLGDFARAGYTRMDVGPSNKANIVLHQKPDPGNDTYSSWHNYFPAVGNSINFVAALGSGGLGEILWPDCSVGGNQGTGGAEVRHVIAHDGSNNSRNLLTYWRYDEGTFVWSGPVIIDSTGILGYVIEGDDNSQKVAIAYHSAWPADGLNGVRNIAYRESFTSGLGWLSGAELGPATKNIITAYADPAGKEAWVHISVAYDHASCLNIIWDEQEISGQTENIAILHWSSCRGTARTISLGYYDNPGITAFNLNLAKPTLGIGDGSESCQDGADDNLDYQYVLYTKQCGETNEEADDVSALGFCNGELYLTVSNTSGNTWSPPVNLTNTKTPGCNADSPYLEMCASEHWATIARDIDDHIDIFYIRDYDAGGIPQGEGVWTVNRAMYMRLPDDGTKAENREFVCPVIAPNYFGFVTSTPNCEYHADANSANVETLTIKNLGNAALSGSVEVTMPVAGWLSVSGLVGLSIGAGGADDVRTVTMGPIATEGLYVGNIRIIHNDTTKPSPVDFEIEFFVVNGFECPEHEIFRTAVASPGVLWTEVNTSGRFGNRGDEGGLWRFLDSSTTIFDGTLAIAHGPQAAGDTVVYHTFFNRNDPGQNGFRALTELEIDTSAYGTHTGYASARGVLTTADSAIGIGMEWYFPQGTAYADFVIAKYTVWNRTSTAINDVLIGLWADLDVVGAAHMRSVQDGVGNHGASDAGVSGRNLIYLYGYDTVGHVPADYFNSSERYSGGLSYMVGNDASGAPFSYVPAFILGGTRDNRENQLGGGPTSNRLYHTLTGAHRVPPGQPGMEIWEPFPDADSVKDAYTFLMLDRNRTLEADGTNPEVYIMAWLSDTLEHGAYGPAPGKSLAGGLPTVVDSAWSWAQQNVNPTPWTGVDGCPCPCHADPVCDGLLNIVDLINVIDVAIRSGESTFDGACTFAREDVDCSGFVNILDVVSMMGVLFRGLDPAISFCDPNPSPCSEVLDPGFCEPGVPTPGNAVVVESKLVTRGATGVEVGIYVTNAIDLTALVLPLEIREVSGGAYMANTFDLRVQGRVGSSGLMDFTDLGVYNTPAGNSCSGPVSQSYSARTFPPGVPSAPSDAIIWQGANSTGACLGSGTDGSPGTGTPSFVLTFDVASIDGTFEIDTCCVTPSNHLVFAECGTSNCILPAFVKGVITVGTPPSCNRSETDPYLLACPKGDIFFDVTLQDGAYNPLVGYDAWLDFSDCSATEFLPRPGEYPLWPLVYSLLPSDENGLVRFAIAAGGDCADCNVTVHTDCGFTATVPVRSVDIDGDMCVTILDRNEGLGSCRDVNADGLVNEHDFLRLTDHCCGHCFPNNPCDRLSLQFVELGCGLQPEDIVQLSWTIYNSQQNVPCDIDSVVIYETLASIPPVWEWVGAISVGQTLDPGDSRIDSLEYTLPALKEFGYQARLYTACCDSFLVEQNIGVVDCRCPPATVCFEFYVQHVDPFEDTVVTWSSPDLQLLYGWTYSIRDTTNDSVASGPLTIVEICTSDITPVGRGGILTIDFCPAGGYCQERLQFEVWHRYFQGDLCGGPNRTPDCKVDVFDVVCLVDYIFRGGPLPKPPENADINCDEVDDVLDIVTLVDFVFRNNAQPPDCNVGPGQF